VTALALSHGIVVPGANRVRLPARYMLSTASMPLRSQYAILVMPRARSASTPRLPQRLVTLNSRL
jgi:hypothetical protein